MVTNDLWIHQKSLNYALSMGKFYLNKVVFKNHNSGSLRKGAQKDFLSTNGQVLYLDLGDGNIGVNTYLSQNQSN